MKKIIFAALLCCSIPVFGQPIGFSRGGGGIGVATDTTHFLHGTDTVPLRTDVDLKAPIDDPTFTTGIAIGSADIEEAELEILDGASVTTTELNYVSGVTSAIQTQINTKVTGDIDSLEYDATLGAIRGHANSGDTIPLYTPYADRIDIGDVAVLLDNNDNNLESYQAMGSSMIAMPVGLNLNNITTNSAFDDGYARYSAVHLRVETVVTGVKFVLGVQGDYTADNYNGIAIYSHSGGTLTLIDSTARDGDIWKAAAASMQTKAFPNGPHTLDAGIYYIFMLYNSSAQSTAPSIFAATAGAAILSTWDFTNNLFLYAYKTSTTVPPTTVSTSDMVPAGASGQRPFFMLY